MSSVTVGEEILGLEVATQTVEVNLPNTLTIGGGDGLNLGFLVGFDKPVTLATALDDNNLAGFVDPEVEVPVLAQGSAAENGVYQVTADGLGLENRRAFTDAENLHPVTIFYLVSEGGPLFNVQRQTGMDLTNGGVSVFPQGLDPRSGAALTIAGLAGDVDAASGWKGALGPMPASTMVMRSSMGGQWVTTGVVGNPTERMVQRAWVQHEGPDWSLVPLLDEWFGELFTRLYDTANFAPPANAPAGWEADLPEGALLQRRSADGSISLFYEILSQDEWSNPTHLNPDTDLLYPAEDYNTTWLGDFRPGQELGLAIDHDLDAGTVTALLEVTAGWDFETVDADGTHGWKILGTRTDDKLHTIYDPEHGVWLFLKNFPGAARKGSLWFDGTRVLAPNAANGTVGATTVVGDEGETWTFESLGGPVGTGGVDTMGVAGSSGPSLSDIPPQPLAGTASEGASSEASRADHAHLLPTPAMIGAAVAGGNIDGSQIQSGTVPWIHLPSEVAEESSVASRLAGKVPTSRTLADLDLSANRTTAELRAALGLILVRKSADETVNNSATLQDDDHLSVSVGASKVYRFRAVLGFGGDSTADVKFQLVGPSGSSAVLMVFGPGPGTGGGDTGLVSAGTGIVTVGLATNIAFGCGGSGSGTIRRWSAIIEGIVTTSTTAGTLKLQWAQNVQTAADTKVFAGSFLDLQEVA